ncbi:Reverse transcriptase domain, Reverse transcriptase zinc-binding domain protein [Quillaja saponaria]|uniref:Reverse transcriptase domain, Reverse transcriptase zinc-binding domain protein n=1 Tax=Quillaja saponaria TaxID=32244 RepID=A0AAD7VKL1_QUISA|nr:Reverse transcriptase domain, Reverse transcriptase zinc-binding domain protein [Quillaja saponaria]
MWRLVHDSVAIRDNLRIRIGGVDNSCSLCGFEAKTGVHLFTSCRYTLKVWDELSLVQILPSSQSDTFGQWWYQLCQSLNGTALVSLDLIGHGIWCIWKARNDKVFNNLIWSEFEVASETIQDRDEFRNDNETSRNIVRLPTNSSRLCNGCWQVPAPGYLK